METLNLTKDKCEYLFNTAQSSKRISGSTHTYYKYPARFSPELIRCFIETFSEIGDLILDPFVGGGTTLVESRRLGRQSIGNDINSLAAFVANVKTSLLSGHEIAEVLKWKNNIDKRLSLNNTTDYDFQNDRYFHNLNSKSIWPLRNTIVLALDSLQTITNKKSSAFIRCALLKTSQWALESRRNTPSAAEYRIKLKKHIDQMLASNSEYRTQVLKSDKLWKPKNTNRRVIIRNLPTQSLCHDHLMSRLTSPKLIITSPPYPGVHMLYHRWQVNGRRETSIPYKIANTLDGSGITYYTFGNRKQELLSDFFNNTYETFKSLASIASQETLIIQVIAFSDKNWQLPLYLETLEDAGLREVSINYLHDLSSDGRIWRKVPNRKWHATQKGQINAAKEVVLFHKLK